MGAPPQRWAPAVVGGSWVPPCWCCSSWDDGQGAVPSWVSSSITALLRPPGSCRVPSPRSGAHLPWAGARWPGAGCQPGSVQHPARRGGGGPPNGTPGVARSSPVRRDGHLGQGTDIQPGQSCLGLPEGVSEWWEPPAPGRAARGLQWCRGGRARGAVAAPSPQGRRLPLHCFWLGDLGGFAPGAVGHRVLGGTGRSGGGLATGSVPCRPGLPEGAAFHHQLQPHIWRHGHGHLQGDMLGSGGSGCPGGTCPAAPPSPPPCR